MVDIQVSWKIRWGCILMVETQNILPKVSYELEWFYIPGRTFRIACKIIEFFYYFREKREREKEKLFLLFIPLYISITVFHHLYAVFQNKRAG